MSVWRMLLGGAAIGVILTAFRDFENGRWLRPAGMNGGFTRFDDDEIQREPILGYDGMDQETLLNWLDESDLDAETLMRVRWYEQRNLAREPVLDALDGRL